MSFQVGFGCCVGSWDKFARCVIPPVGDAQVLGLSGQTSIADAYNAILGAYAYADLDMVVLQHDDLEIVDPGAIDKFAKTFADHPDIALIGVAGGSVRGGLGWWAQDPIGRVQAETTLVDFGARSGEVEMLDGCLLVFSPWALRYLRFTSRPGFHGYDADIATTARRKHGKRVMVVDVEVHHHTALGFDDEASHMDWLAADAWFRQKWSI
jgi:GT2 family glycosyltransferase